MSDDDDRSRDASSAADRGWGDGEDLTVAWSTAVAPDDISELAADVKAYRREQRSLRRGRTVHRVMSRPYAAPLTMVVAALALAALVATLISLVIPTASRPPAAMTLSQSTALPTAGGLLPQVSLTDAIGGAPVASRSLRPAVLALVPEPCKCTALLNRIAVDAHAEQLRMVVIAPTGSDAEVSALTGTLDQGQTEGLYDTGDALASGVHSTGLTVVAVNRDGTVYTITRSVTAQNVGVIGPNLVRMLATKPSG